MNEHANLVILFIIAKLFEYNVHKKSLNEGGFSPRSSLNKGGIQPKSFLNKGGIQPKSSLNEGKTRFSPPYYIYKGRDDIIIKV